MQKQISRVGMIQQIFMAETCLFKISICIVVHNVDNSHFYLDAIFRR
jgi:hypothetical protein